MISHCDRCWAEIPDDAAPVTLHVFGLERMHVMIDDLCQECAGQLRTWLLLPKWASATQDARDEGVRASLSDREGASGTTTLGVRRDGP